MVLSLKKMKMFVLHIMIFSFFIQNLESSAQAFPWTCSQKFLSLGLSGSTPAADTADVETVAEKKPKDKGSDSQIDWLNPVVVSKQLAIFGKTSKLPKKVIEMLDDGRLLATIQAQIRKTCGDALCTVEQFQESVEQVVRAEFPREFGLLSKAKIWAIRIGIAMTLAMGVPFVTSFISGWASKSPGQSAALFAIIIAFLAKMGNSATPWVDIGISKFEYAIKRLTLVGRPIDKRVFGSLSEMGNQDSVHAPPDAKKGLGRSEYLEGELVNIVRSIKTIRGTLKAMFEEVEKQMPGFSQAVNQSGPSNTSQIELSFMSQSSSATLSGAADLSLEPIDWIAIQEKWNDSLASALHSVTTSLASLSIQAEELADPNSTDSLAERAFINGLSSRYFGYLEKAEKAEKEEKAARENNPKFMPANSILGEKMFLKLAIVHIRKFLDSKVEMKTGNRMWIANSILEQLGGKYIDLGFLNFK